MKFRIQNDELRIVSRETFSPVRPPHVPFRPHCVILTHRRSRAHQRSCAASEESPNFKANPSFMCGDSSSQAPQNDKEKRNEGGRRPKARLFHVKQAGLICEQVSADGSTSH